MKKLMCVISSLMIALCLLSSCVQNEKIDIYIFASRFNRYSDNFRIDKKEFCAEENENELYFPICFENKFLVCIRTDIETSEIKSCSVSFAFKNKKREINQSEREKFAEIILCSIRAYGKYNRDFSQMIFKKLGIDNKKVLVNDTDVSFNKDFYEYDFISDEMGIYFSMKNSRV